ncbi:peroxisomal targeting signal 2 receptor [Malassezia pachydermatis]
MAAAKRYPTQGFAGYNVAWSPFFPDRLAVASSANYGLVGNGRLHLFGATPAQTKIYDTQDGIFDIAWSEIHENQIASACGDGSIKLWDASLNDHPIRNWTEHGREVFSLDWNNIQKDLFASSSWDGLVKIWHPERPASIQTIQAHGACVYKCAWSPHNPTLLATASADGSAHIFDTRQVGRPVSTMSVGGEVLALDWNKYRPMTLATGGTDRSIKVWEARGQGESMVPETCVMVGHQYAIRGVAWSPHKPDIVASASYDMTARIWSTEGAGVAAQVPMVNQPRQVYTGHREFVVGIAWSLFEPGMIATTSWDMETHVWPAMV